jgi:hypothetical protein
MDTVGGLKGANTSERPSGCHLASQRNNISFPRARHCRRPRRRRRRFSRRRRRGNTADSRPVAFLFRHEASPEPGNHGGWKGGRVESTLARHCTSVSLNNTCPLQRVYGLTRAIPSSVRTYTRIYSRACTCAYTYVTIRPVWTYFFSFALPPIPRLCLFSLFLPSLSIAHSHSAVL